MSTSPSLTRSPSVSQAAHSPRPPSLLRFEGVPENDPVGELHPEDLQDEDDIPYLEPGSEQTLLPPPNFQPFFTLIEDMTTGEHHHPYVHYVFADDDPVIMTAASMRGLGLDDTKYLLQVSVDGEEAMQHHTDLEGGELDLPAESPLLPPIPGVKEHYLVVDVGADGRTVTDAQSLSSEWQITKTDVRTAPSLDDSSLDQGYMLRVEGIEISQKNKGKGKGPAGRDQLSEAREKSHGDIFKALDSLVEGIEGGLDVAGKISKQDTAGTQATILANTLGQQQSR